MSKRVCYICSAFLLFFLLSPILVQAASQTLPSVWNGFGEWAEVESDSNYAVGVKSDGSMWVWGYVYNLSSHFDGDYQLTSPAMIDNGQWKSGAVGAYSLMAVKNDGTLWYLPYSSYGLRPYGSDTDWVSLEQDGNNAYVYKSDGSRYAFDQYGSLVSSPKDPDWVETYNGTGFTVALKVDGTIWGWGINSSGALGPEIGASYSTPVQIGSDNDWASISAGYSHVAALKKDGSIWAWGENSSGQIGDSTHIKKTEPYEVCACGYWKSIMAAGDGTYAIKNDGTLYSWGNNSYGAGKGFASNTIMPVRTLGGAKDWSSITAGSHHGAGIRNDGSLWTWGQGPVADGTTGPVYYPVQIGKESWAKVKAGSGFTLAVKPDGTLWSWGSNEYQQLGRPAPISQIQSLPGQIGTDNDWSEISTSDTRSAARKRNGTLWTFGQELSDSPVQVNTDTDWADFSAGTHFLAVKNNGTLWAWGVNSYYQLGDGTKSSQSKPIQIGTDSDWAKVVAGAGFSMALKKDGTLWGWGRDISIEWINDETVLPFSKTPKQIGTDSNWASLAAGNLHALAVKNNGTLWGWGYAVSNYNTGYMGPGGSSKTPVQIGTDTDWTDVEASGFSYAGKLDGSVWGFGSNSYGGLGLGDMSISTLGPVASASVRINDGDFYTSSATVNLSISCELFAFGCAQMQFSEDNANWSAAEPFSSTKIWQFSSGEGLKTVYVKLRDSSGQWSGPYAQSITYTTTVQPASIYINSKALRTSSAEVALALSCSWCVEMQFSEDNANWFAAEPFSSSKSWTLSGADGVKTVYARFKDSAGSWSVVYGNSIILDATAPTGSIGINSGSQSTNTSRVMLTLGCLDDCAEMKFSDNGTSWSASEAYSPFKEWTLASGDGTKTVYVKFKDWAGNWSYAYGNSINVDSAAPICTLSINNGEPQASSNKVALYLTCGETCPYMQFSNDGSTWSATEAYSQTKSDWTLSTDQVMKTVYAMLRDSAGNWGSCGDTIIGPSGVTSTWNLAAVAGNAQVSLAWDGITGISGISYVKLVYSAEGYPDSCAYGDEVYSGTASSISHNGLTNGKPFYYRLCVYDSNGDIVSTGSASATPMASVSGISIPTNDKNTPGLERGDGQSETNNIDSTTGNPVIDLEYDFKIVLQDPSGLQPHYVRLYMAQRENPSESDFFGVDLACEGDWASGAACGFSTMLGPSACMKYYFKARLSDSTVIRYPESGTIDGPSIELLNGLNMVGAPRDLTGSLDGAAAFSSSYTYRWVSEGLTSGGNSGHYELVDSSSPVKTGEGYFVLKQDSTLPPLDAYNDVLSDTYELGLNTGWNMISNPYGGNVLLKDTFVKDGSGTLAGWVDAVSSGLVVNAIYYYVGSDWGSTYSYQAAGGGPEASLVPWLSYWIYLKAGTGDYSLVIPKP